MTQLYTPAHEKFRREFREFLATHVTPHQAAWRKAGHVSRDVWKAAGEAGFLCLHNQAVDGSDEHQFLCSIVMCEELSRIHEVGFGILLHNEIVVPYLTELGTPEQRAKYISRSTTGECITAFAMTEPTGGSDVAALATTAVLDSTTGEWILNGDKTFIANGQLCDTALVVASTELDAPRPEWGLSLFLVDADVHGFHRGRNLETFGMAGQDTSELSFRDCRLPPEALLGKRGRGFQYVMERLSRERLIAAATAQARAERVLEETVERVKERRLFGRPLGSFQSIAFGLADCRTQVVVGRAFLESLMTRLLAGHDLMAESAMAKMWHTDMLFEVADICVQAWGAHGTLVDNGVARALVDARMQRIYAGANEVMKTIIGHQLGLGDSR